MIRSLSNWFREKVERAPQPKPFYKFSEEGRIELFGRRCPDALLALLAVKGFTAVIDWRVSIEMNTIPFRGVAGDFYSFEIQGGNTLLLDIKAQHVSGYTAEWNIRGSFAQLERMEATEFFDEWLPTQLDMPIITRVRGIP